MDIGKTIQELKALAPGHDTAVQAKLGELEQQVTTLLAEHAACEQHYKAQLSAIRHSVAQPLTTVQLFLDLLPSVMKQEQMVPEKLVNPRFWTQTHARALDAVKQIPTLLGRPQP